MTFVDLSYYGLRELPRFGKDHLVLADWRMGVPHQRNSGRGGDLLGYAEHRFDHPSGQKTVCLEGGSKVGLPTDHDDLFLIGLLTLAAAMDFPAKIHFEPSHILHVLRMPLRDRHFRRQREAYERFVKLNAMFEGAWFDRKSPARSGDFITGILSEVYYQPKQGRRPKGEQPASYAIFCDNFHQSLKNGNLVNIDLELLARFRSPTAALNFRHLNKVWHSGRKPFHYSSDLRDMACSRLQMTDGKNLKENYGKVLAELEKHEYLLPSSERFEQIKRGVWRVHYDLHPDRVWKPKSPKSTKASTDAEAMELVTKYRELRFPNLSVGPEGHELRAARALLDEHNLLTLISVTPQVVAKVASQNRDDLFFGFAVPYYQKEVAGQNQSTETKKQQDKQAKTVNQDVGRLEREGKQKRDQHQARLKLWQAATEAERDDFVQAALSKANTPAARQTILNASFDKPPAVILRQIKIVSSQLPPTTA